MLRLDGENNTWVSGMNQLISLFSHFPKHKRCKSSTISGAGLDNDQPHFFKSVPKRLIDLFQWATLNEQIGIYEIVKCRSAHDVYYIFEVLEIATLGRGSAIVAKNDQRLIR